MYTYHSVKRTTKRAKLNRTAAVRMIERAWNKGKRPGDFGRKEREYLQHKEYDGQKVVVYAGYCFVFNAQDVCVTMFGVPDWFEKNCFQGKAQIRNPRKYYRRYSTNSDDYMHCAV